MKIDNQLNALEILLEKAIFNETSINTESSLADSFCTGDIACGANCWC